MFLGKNCFFKNHGNRRTDIRNILHELLFFNKMQSYGKFQPDMKHVSVHQLLEFYAYMYYLKLMHIIKNAIVNKTQF